MNHDKSPKIVWVEIERIKEAHFNPQGRTEQQKLKKLLSSFKKHGFKPYRPLLLAGDGTLADGHRRLSCARILGLTHVPVIYTGDALYTVFSQNDGIEPYRSGEWLQAFASGLPLTEVPSPYSKQIQKLIDVLGEPDVLNLAMNGYSLHILSVAKAVCKYCDLASDADLKSVILWLAKHDMQYDARKAMDIHADADLIMDAIENDKPFKTGVVLG